MTWRGVIVSILFVPRKILIFQCGFSIYKEECNLQLKYDVDFFNWVISYCREPNCLSNWIMTASDNFLQKIFNRWLYDFRFRWLYIQNLTKFPEFQNISVEESDGCQYDSIVISDTKNVSLDRSARLCGLYHQQDPTSFQKR